MNAKGFARWLAKTRKQRGWTQNDLASRLGITLGRVSQWEQAAITSAGSASLPPLETLIAISKILGVDVREPLQELGVLKDEPIELTAEERVAVDHLRALPPEGIAAALDILNSLKQFGAGVASRRITAKRSARGFNPDENKAVG